jgi:phosphotransferase system  glucose/maltose/N-acetylglucosamine-specific IIC component
MEHVGKLTNLKQVSLAILMKRSIALLLAVFMLLSSFPALRPQNWIWIVLIVMVAVVFITFRILIRRARN